MFVVADVGELLVEALSNGRSLGVNLAVKSDGLIRRAVHSFARNSTDEIGEFCRVRSIVRILLFLIKSVMLSLVANVMKLTF